MDGFVAALNEYGVGLVLVAFALLNAGKIWKAAEWLFVRIFPALAERQEHEQKLIREGEEHKRKRLERDQVAAIEIAREVLTTYRDELSIVRQEYHDEMSRMQKEREQMTQRLFGILGDYEQNIERVTSALISVNTSLQALTRKVEQFSERR